MGQNDIMTHPQNGEGEQKGVRSFVFHLFHLFNLLGNSLNIPFRFPSFVTDTVNGRLVRYQQDKFQLGLGFNPSPNYG